MAQTMRSVLSHLGTFVAGCALVATVWIFASSSKRNPVSPTGELSSGSPATNTPVYPYPHMEEIRMAEPASAAAALDRINSTPFTSDSQRVEAVQMLASSLAKDGWEDAVEFADSLPTLQMRATALEGILHCLVDQDLDVDAFLSAFAYEARIYNWNTYYTGHLLDEDVEKAIDWVNSRLHGDQQVEAYRLVIRTLLERDPERAKRFVLNMPPGAIRGMAIGQVLSPQSEFVPQEALEWVSALEPGEERENGFYWLGNRWNVEDPEEAEPVLESLSGQDRIQFALGFVPALANENPVEVIEWASQHFAEEPVILESLLSSSYHIWGYKDPEPAFAHVMLTTDPELRSSLLRTIASEWSQRNPQAATQAFAAVYSEMNEGSAYLFTLRRWIDHSPLQASAWIRELPPGELFDDSVGTLLLAEGFADPAAAVIWSAQISAPANRKRALVNWSKRLADTQGHEKAFEVIDGLGLSQEERTWLMERISS